MSLFISQPEPSGNGGKLVREKRTSVFGSILLALTGQAAIAQVPTSLSDLVGSRAASGETQMKARGYDFVKVEKGDDRSYTTWWNLDKQRLRCMSTACFSVCERRAPPAFQMKPLHLQSFAMILRQPPNQLSSFSEISRRRRSSIRAPCWRGVGKSLSAMFAISRKSASSLAKMASASAKT